MEHGRWSDISSDPELAKKVFFGSFCLSTFLFTPFALGALATDLETEAKLIEEKKPSGHLPTLDNFALLLGKGIIPTFILGLVLLLSLIPGIPAILSFVKLLTVFKSEFGTSFFSLLTSAGLGIAALALQFLVSLLCPIAFAQHARGVSLRTAMDPLSCASYAIEMGSTFWLKASGMWLAFLLGIILSITGMSYMFQIPAFFIIMAPAYVSLALSSRYALRYILRN